MRPVRMTPPATHAVNVRARERRLLAAFDLCAKWRPARFCTPLLFPHHNSRVWTRVNECLVCICVLAFRRPFVLTLPYPTSGQATFSTLPLQVLANRFRRSMCFPIPSHLASNARVVKTPVPSGLHGRTLQNCAAEPDALPVGVVVPPNGWRHVRGLAQNRFRAAVLWRRSCSPTPSLTG